MRAFKYFIGVVLFAVLFGCGKKAEIVGIVLDNFGKAVEGATVKIENTAFTATTDKNGRYHIGYVPGKVDVSILKQGYTEEKLNLNIAVESKFPAKDVTLYRLPSGNGFFAYGSNDYIPLKQGAVTIQRSGWMGADSSYYVSGSMFSVIKGSQTVLLDNDGKEQRILEVKSNGLVVAPGLNIAPINVPVTQVGQGVFLWDITSLKSGRFALVTTAVTYGGLVPIDPVYLFEVRKSVPQLIMELSDPNIKVRQDAIVALGNIGPEAKSAVLELTKILNDSNVNMRQFAAYTLGRIGPEARSAVPELIKILNDSNVDVRINAAYALGGIGSAAKSAIPELIKALNASDFRLRQLAAYALGGIGPEAKDAVPALIKLLSKDSEYFVRLATAKALGNIGPEAKSAVPALTKALNDFSIDIRKEAATALGKMDIKVKSEEGLGGDNILENLTRLKDAVEAYHTDHFVYSPHFPGVLEELVPKYITEIPKVCLPQHGCSNKATNKLTDTGGWVYTDNGSVYVNCLHEKSSGTPWYKAH